MFFKESQTTVPAILLGLRVMEYPMEKPITILLASDHRLVSKAWQFILGLDQRFYVVDECKNFESILHRAKTLRPDIILMDFNKKRMQELNVIPFIEKVSPGSSILGVSMYTLQAISDTPIHPGVSGYLTKSSTIKELLEAIVEVKAGKKYLCRELRKFSCQQSASKAAPQGLSILSLRETDVIAGLSNGLGLKEIAQEFKVPCRTINKHYEMILKKLGLNNASELIEYLKKPPEL